MAIGAGVSIILALLIRRSGEHRATERQEGQALQGGTEEPHA